MNPLQLLRQKCLELGVKIRWKEDYMDSRADHSGNLINIPRVGNGVGETDVMIIGFHEIGHLQTRKDWLDKVQNVGQHLVTNNHTISISKIWAEDLAWEWAMKNLPTEVHHRAHQIRRWAIETYFATALNS